MKHIINRYICGPVLRFIIDRKAQSSKERKTSCGFAYKWADKSLVLWYTKSHTTPNREQVPDCEQTIGQTADNKTK